MSTISEERAPRRLGAPAKLALLAPLLAGAALRLAQLRDQLLTGDELHSVKAAVAMPVAEILRTWSYHGADYCVPLTALFRMLMDAGIALSEMDMRLPALVTGIASLVVMPRVLSPRLGIRGTRVFAWLLAFSPMLVLYSRTVRSYMPATLFAFAAVMGFERWWRTGSRSAAAGYALLAPLALYFHLAAAPFVAAPVVLAALRIAASRGDPAQRRARAAALAALAAGAAAVVALLLLPALASLRALAGNHGAGRLPNLAGWLHVTQIQVGVAALPLVAALAVAGLRGAGLLFRADREFALYLAGLALIQLLGLALLAPNFFEHAGVAARYLIPLLPFGLAVCALGLTHPVSAGRFAAARWLQPLGAAALLVALFAAGPFARAEFRWSSFLHAPTFIDLATRPDSMPEAEVPEFYRNLGDGAGALIEFPWENTATHALAVYQRAHRRRVLASPAAARKLHDPRLALRNMIPPDPQAFLRSPARYVVVHPNLRAEEVRIATEEFHHARRLYEAPQVWEILRWTGSTLEARLRREWGPPDFEDASIRVWDLETVRRLAARSGVADG